MQSMSSLQQGPHRSKCYIHRMTCINCTMLKHSQLARQPCAAISRALMSLQRAGVAVLFSQS